VHETESNRFALARAAVQCSAWPAPNGRP